MSSLQPDVEKIFFDTDTILHTSFFTSDIQQKYFILDSLEQLNESIYRLGEKWSSAVNQGDSNEIILK
jgi:phenylalanine-4-hydroxylase